MYKVYPKKFLTFAKEPDRIDNNIMMDFVFAGIPIFCFYYAMLIYTYGKHNATYAIANHIVTKPAVTDISTPINLDGFIWF